MGLGKQNRSLMKSRLQTTLDPVEHLKIPAIPNYLNYFVGHFGNLCYPEAGAAPRSLPGHTLPPPALEAAQCRALWPRILVGEGQGLGALQPTDPTSFQFRGIFSEFSPRPQHPLGGVRSLRGGAWSWLAGPFTCCVQKRVVDIPFGAAAGFLVTGAGDLPGGSPGGHAPAALRWLSRVSIEQSWTKTWNKGPESAGDSLGSFIPTHLQPRDSAEPTTLLQPAAGPRPCLPFSPSVPPLTAQLVSDAAGELLGHLAPRSRCNRQAGKSESEREQTGE